MAVAVIPVVSLIVVAQVVVLAVVAVILSQIAPVHQVLVVVPIVVIMMVVIVHSHAYFLSFGLARRHTRYCNRGGHDQPAEVTIQIAHLQSSAPGTNETLAAATMHGC